MTNGDKIRAMSDEELAEYLSAVGDGVACPGTPEKHWDDWKCPIEGTRHPCYRRAPAVAQSGGHRVMDGKWKVGSWSPGEHCVIEWTALPEPPFFAANYRKVAEVYDKADVPKLAAAKEMYEALKDLMDAMDDVLYNADRVPDCIVAVAQEAMDKAKAARKKARGEK